MFYPRRDFREGPPNSTDYQVPVDGDISIGCRFYVHSNRSPSVLFFHGNGEVVSDYDGIAPLYHQQGINLFVADYRGYGSSGGTPTFTSLASDSHKIFQAFRDILRNDHHSGNSFVMGRSLGSICAIELAASYPQEIKGLIIESGFASIWRLLRHLCFPAQLTGIADLSFPNAAKVRSVLLPTLILHGEFDTLVPLAEAKDLLQNTAAREKRLVIIRGAGHNDIMLVGMEEYFQAIKEFVLGKDYAL